VGNGILQLLGAVEYSLALRCALRSLWCITAMVEKNLAPVGSRVWSVGALCRAIADALDARFNPVTVAGEIAGFTRAASGHCYFTLKDDSGQVRCAMFRRAAALLDFPVRDGDRVEVQGRVGVYEPRGELQLVVETMRRAGQGTLFEQFLKLKAKLEQEGLFDVARKRAVPLMPRGIGIVTSLGAAALHDVVTALQRRVPHIPVLVVPAAVQGEGAPRELIQALLRLYERATVMDAHAVPIDVILLVRGGGAMEDLWAFNDEQLARTIVESPVPVICGVGHETDFTIADFVADLRAPTPTAAAELVSESRQAWLGVTVLLDDRMGSALTQFVDRQAQRLDLTATRIGRPSLLAGRQRLKLQALEQQTHHAMHVATQSLKTRVDQQHQAFATACRQHLVHQRDRIDRAGLRLGLLDPSLVLQRGYAWLTLESGGTMASVDQAKTGEQVRATLADGMVDLRVLGTRSI
jgi:exodeoxyribonuclease VII large subunit